MSNVIKALTPNPITPENSNIRKCCPEVREMANDYYEAMLKARGALGSMNEGAPMWYAKELYAKGYRKATDVAEEIFAEIEKLIIRRMIPDVALIDDKLITDIAELKKEIHAKEGK